MSLLAQLIWTVGGLKLLVDMTNLLLMSCVATVKTLCLLIDWVDVLRKKLREQKTVVTTANRKK